MSNNKLSSNQNSNITMNIPRRTQQYRNKRLREILEREDAWQRHTVNKSTHNINPHNNIANSANSAKSNFEDDDPHDFDGFDAPMGANIDDLQEDFNNVENLGIGGLSMQDLVQATCLTKETIEMDIGKVFRLNEYRPVSTYRELCKSNNGQLGRSLFVNQSCKYSLLDTIIFFNGLLKHYPTTPMDAIDSMLKWIHGMTENSNIPESFAGLNKCLTIQERIIEVPFCSTKGCGHIFDPNIDVMQSCPKCHKEGYKKSNRAGSEKQFLPIATFEYSPVIWKEMDMIVHNSQFRHTIQRNLPNRSKDSDLIFDFVDAEQCTAFINNYSQERFTLYLAFSEMVDGISRSLCSPENLTAQLICYASLPISERNKHANIFVTAICRSEDQPHANVLRRMLIGELEYSK
jgi:predicted Zn-ribbon and HTH transcriptional regulator